MPPPELSESTAAKIPLDWAPGDQWILYQEYDERSKFNLVLARAEQAVGVANLARERGVDQAEFARNAQQRNIARVACKRRMRAAVQQHEVLHRELDIDHAAAVVLEVEQTGRVRMPFRHLAAHLHDIGA